MSRPPVAFLLSFVVPGLGLIYLGKTTAGIVNLAVAIVIPLVMLLVWRQAAFDFLHYALLAVAAGSAGAAHAASMQQ